MRWGQCFGLLQFSSSCNFTSPSRWTLEGRCQQETDWSFASLVSISLLSPGPAVWAAHHPAGTVPALYIVYQQSQDSYGTILLSPPSAWHRLGVDFASLGASREGDAGCCGSGAVGVMNEMLWERIRSPALAMTGEQCRIFPTVLVRPLLTTYNSLWKLNYFLFSMTPFSPQHRRKRPSHLITACSELRKLEEISMEEEEAISAL